MSTQTIKVLSKGSSTSVAKETGMTVGSLREKLGIPDHLTANANGSTMNDSQLIADIDRISFTRGSDNNADNANVDTDDLVAVVEGTMGQAAVAYDVFKASCDKNAKPNCDKILANELNAGGVIDRDDAIAILGNVQNAISGVLPELLLRSASDEAVAKLLTKTAKQLVKFSAREGKFSQA